MVNPYTIIRSRYITEKSSLLERLFRSEKKSSSDKPSFSKYVFVVDRSATKQDIARAVETIYSDRGIKVASVNTLNVKPKKRTVRGRKGVCSRFKKAIVTLEKDGTLEELV